MALPVGSKAPDFTLRTRSQEQNSEVKLSDNFGRRNSVLLFFPGAFTPVCARQMCDFTGGLPMYEGLNAQVYGISPDSPYALEAWAKEIAIGVPLLSDYQREVTRDYDVAVANFSGLGPGTGRAVFVIDKEGVIRHSEQTEKLADLPDYEAVRVALESLG